MSLVAHCTHIPVLRALGTLPEWQGKRIVEFGGGLFSTPHLLYYLRPSFLTTYDTDDFWVSVIDKLYSLPGHCQVNGTQGSPMADVVASALQAAKPDIIFIDDSYTEDLRTATIRAVVAQQVQDTLVIMHDAHIDQYLKALRFKSHIIFNGLYPPTAVCCDAKDVDFSRVRNAIKSEEDRWKQ